MDSLLRIWYLTKRYIPPSFIVKNKYDAALLTKLLATKETTIHGSKLLYWPFNECYHCKLCTEAVTLY
jgi:hypothetical protein